MPLEIVTVPCRADNYAFLLHNAASGQTALIDAPEAGAIRAALDSRGWTLSDLFITHHHDDHIAGVAALRPGARVIGNAADAHRLPPLDLAVHPGDTITLCGEPGQIIDVPGHTVGHIALHLPNSRAAFTADSLMALGCGRLLEGTAQQMWDSLTRLAALPRDTLICSGHEYTAANGRFAITIEPDNLDLQARIANITIVRSQGIATVPSTLDLELRTNPFLRAGLASIKASLNMATAHDVDSFAEIRARKDRF